MDLDSKDGGHRGAKSVAVAAVFLLLAGLVILYFGSHQETDPPVAATTPDSTPSSPASPRERTKDRARSSAATSDFGRVLPGSPPVSLSIPSIGVQAGTIVGLGLADNGEIEVPADPMAPGWFTPGPSPGQLGPAVIAGHVDSTTGPAVFYRLGELGPGDRVRITRQDGSVATFRVEKVSTYEKDAFPTRSVYGPTDAADLRLITCAGDYDPEAGYLSNTVVYATLI